MINFANAVLKKVCERSHFCVTIIHSYRALESEENPMKEIYAFQKTVRF